MSMRSLFSGVTQALGRRDWTVRHTLPDGSQIASLSPEFADELMRVLSSRAPIDMNEPLVLNSVVNGVPLVLNLVGDGEQHRAIAISDSYGRRRVVGIGLGEEGGVANNLVPHPAYRLDPECIARRFADTGGRGGAVELAPNTPSRIPGATPGPGYVPTQGFTAGFDSGFNCGRGASGIPEDYDQFTGLFGGQSPVNIRLDDLADVDVPDPADNDVLQFNSTTGQWEAVAPGSGGAGDVSGPASSTDNAIATFDGTTGKVLQNSQATLVEGSLKITGSSGNTDVTLNHASPNARAVFFQTDGDNRWSLFCNNDTESGSDAGATLSLRAYDDSGSLIDSPLTFVRAAGGAITCARPLVMSAALQAWQRTDANRGAAGTPGRIIFNTDDGNLNIDDGTNWILPDGTTT